ncbi:hypothetical protein ACLOJK_006470 [Asimina triloba]
MFSSDDLGSLHSCYHIPDSIKLFTPREGETLHDHFDGSIYLKEWMFKDGVRIPFEFGILELLHVISTTLMQVSPNSWKIAQSSQLPSLGVIAIQECGARGSSSGGVRAYPSTREEAEYLSAFDWRGAGACPSSIRPLSMQGRALEEEEDFGERYMLLPLRVRVDDPGCGGRTVVEAGRGGPSIKPRRRIPKATTGPVHSGLAPSPVPMVDIEGNAMSPKLTSEREPSGTSTEAAQEDAEARTAKDQCPVPRGGADPREAGASVHCGVLGATFGEAFSCIADDNRFRHTFDIEARALKILDNHLSMQSRSLKESHALGLTSSLEKEGRGPIEWMLLEFLPDVWQELTEWDERIRLIDGCASRAEYHYHMLRESVFLSVERPQA